MALFYGGHANQRFFGFISWDEQDATFHYIRHYRNYLILDFMSKNSAEYNDREQARKELGLCERSLDRWKNHPNWDEGVVLPIIEQFKKRPISDLIADWANEE